MTLTEEKFLRVEQERNRILEKILKTEEKNHELLKEFRTNALIFSKELEVLKEGEPCSKEESTSLT